MICYYYEQPQYFFFASDLPDLLYYSHIPVSIIALMVGFYVFFNARHLLLNRLLLLISICFSSWTILNLITWTNINSETLLFSWSFLGILQVLISALSVYFIYVFLHRENMPWCWQAVLAALILPVIVFAPTTLNLTGFNIADCDAFGYENLFYTYYFTGVGIVSMIWILLLLIKQYRKVTTAMKNQIILMGVGIELFLFSFFTIVFLAGYLTTLGFFENSDLELYSLFGMGVFMTMIGTLMVKHKTFSVGMIAPQALVIALLALVASQFTYVTNTTGMVLTSITLVLTSMAGLLIVRNVRKEIAQKEEIEKLAKKLERANKRLKVLDKMKSEFVSIASHQLRSPLTSIRGYASMLLEGSYGKLSAKATEAVERIADSSKGMASSVEDYLNVSRIQAGNMKYEMSDFNIKDKAEAIADDIRQTAMKKGLLLTFKSDLDGQGIVNADVGKVQQILHNLINNALKYTPKGMITVFVHDDKKKKRIFVDIIDTGVGMDPDTIESMFEKFERAEDANKVNVSGTGLGLYIAQKMANEMKGDVYATSPGLKEGSTFTLELPLML